MLREHTEIFFKPYVTYKHGYKSGKDDNSPYKIIVKQEREYDKYEFLLDLKKRLPIKFWCSRCDSNARSLP